MSKANKQLSSVARLLILLTVVWVIGRLLPVAVDRLSNPQACPSLGVLPACYIVLLAYLAMGVATLAAPRRLIGLFLSGWLPVVLLAASGTLLELSGTPTCPASDTGTPLCYYSLAVALALLPLYWLAARRGADENRNFTATRS